MEHYSNESSDDDQSSQKSPLASAAEPHFERPEPVAGVTQNRKQRRALIASGWGLLKKLAHLGRIEALKQRACRIYLRQYFWMWGMEVVYRHQRDALRRNPPRRRVNRDP